MRLERRLSPALRAGSPTDGGRRGPAEVAAAGGRRMVQKESQAALEERESELNANPAVSAGASLEPPAAPAPGEDNPAGTGGAAVAGAAGGARRFLCGVVEGESPGAGWARVSSLLPRPSTLTCSLLVRGVAAVLYGALKGCYSLGSEI